MYVGLRDLNVEEIHQARDSIQRILTDIRTVSTIEDAETALTRIADLLDMPWVGWSPDTSDPYGSRKADVYSRSRGWPEEFLELWTSGHASLTMSFVVRCRFEYVPFVVSLDQKRHRVLDPVSSKEMRVLRFIRSMGISTLLVVPLHLSKGVVATIIWSGRRKADTLADILNEIEGELLAICYRFMQIAITSLGHTLDTAGEQTSLTPREWDCARALAQGYREAEIAELFGIKRVTVRSHLDNIVQKFGCKTRAQTVVLLAQLGLLGPVET